MGTQRVFVFTSSAPDDDMMMMIMWNKGCEDEHFLVLQAGGAVMM